jgi:hypothetical protein
MMGLVVGFFISTVILYHTTFAINSLCHMFGTRRYETGEESKNSLWLAILTMGEGWHNNHHHYPLSCRQGFFWYEIDITYYILLGLSKIGLVWDLAGPAQADAQARSHDRHLQAQARSPRPRPGRSISLLRSGITRTTVDTPLSVHRSMMAPSSGAQDASIDSRVLRSAKRRKPGLSLSIRDRTVPKQRLISSTLTC